MSSVKIIVNNIEVDLNPDNLRFNQTNIISYFLKEGPLYAFYGQALANAERDLQVLDTDLDVLYASKYSFFKADGCTDKQSENNAKSDEDVSSLKKQIVEKKHIVKLLQSYLRALDRNHENAQSLGHMMRKEMDKMSNSNDASDISFSDKPDDEELFNEFDKSLG